MELKCLHDTFIIPGFLYEMGQVMNQVVGDIERYESILYLIKNDTPTKKRH